jgi:ATP-dependent Clp endopeptidase proteolytic subunit ClpP
MIPWNILKTRLNCFKFLSSDSQYSSLLKIYTVGTGVAIGQACVLLSAGDKGKRFMTPHATAMLHQPRVPSTGQQQATELLIKWNEILEQKKSMLNILSSTTGHSIEKIDKVRKRSKFYFILFCLT